MKYAIVILDGASGWPVEKLSGKTSFEAAKTPNLDFMAQNGMVGLSKNVPDGLDPSSNIACTSIMGYDPNEYPIGRGAIEGLNSGIDLKPGQVALRVNLCTVKDGLMFSYSADNISTTEASPIVDALKGALDDEIFTLHKGTGFRCTLVVDGHPEIMECDFYQAHNITDETVDDKYPTGPGADLLTNYMKRADKVLAGLEINKTRVENGQVPVNRLWAFWPGMRPESMKSFKEEYGKDAAMQTGVDLLGGLAALTDMKNYEFEGITDGPDTDYEMCGKGAIEMLEENDVVFIHVEAPDAEGHDGHIQGKIISIEQIDKEIISRLLEYAKDHELRILATPDHPTPVELKRHAAEMVPFAMWGEGIKSNGANRLTEEQAKKTGKVVDPGYKMMSILLA